MKNQIKYKNVHSFTFLFSLFLIPSILLGQDSGLTIIQKTLSSKCIEANSIQNGSDLILHDCKSDDDQKWYFENNAIKLYDNPEYCIELENGIAKEDAKAKLQTCEGTNSQKWLYDGFTQTIRYLDNPEYCLKFYKDYQYATSSKIQLDNCKTVTDYQQWTFREDTPIDLISTGIRNTIYSTPDTTLRVYPGEGRTKNGSQVTAQSVDVDMDQDLIFNADRSISIAKRPDRCLDQLSGSTSNGTKIQVFPCTGYGNQKWYYDSFNQLFRAYEDPYKCMQGGENGTEVVLWTCSSDSEEQQFTIE